MKHSSFGPPIRPRAVLPLIVAGLLWAGCGDGPVTLANELPADQVQALLAAFHDLGVWAAPGGFLPGSMSATVDCTGGGIVDVDGEATAVDGPSLEFSFTFGIGDCSLAGGGLGFAVDGDVSGEGRNLVTTPESEGTPAEIEGSYQVGGELVWRIEETVGTCVLSVSVKTATAEDGQLEATAVDGTICGLPVGNYP